MRRKPVATASVSILRNSLYTVVQITNKVYIRTGLSMVCKATKTIDYIERICISIYRIESEGRNVETLITMSETADVLDKQSKPLE